MAIRSRASLRTWAKISLKKLGVVTSVSSSLLLEIESPLPIHSLKFQPGRTEDNDLLWLDHHIVFLLHCTGTQQKVDVEGEISNRGPCISFLRF